MAKSTIKSKDNPQLKQRELKDGRISLYLEYYLGRTEQPRLDENGNQMVYTTGKMAGKPMWIVKHERKKEDLGLYLMARPRTPEERNTNAETLKTAEKVRYERQQDMGESNRGYRVDTHKNDNLMAYFEEYANTYALTDIRNINLAINRFKTFLRLKYPSCAVKKSASEIKAIDDAWAKRHEHINGKHDVNENEYYRFTLHQSRFDVDMVQAFVQYLQDNSEGSGAATAYARFKKIVKHSCSKGVLKYNPCVEVSCERNDYELRKEVLSAEEMQRLVNTHYEGENPEIRKAFIFSLYTGVRWGDVKTMSFSNIDYSNLTLSFRQNKTKKKGNCQVTMDLRPDLLAMIGTPEESGKSKNDLIFDLPSHTMCIKAVKHWTKKAGIDKHITWHCARHTFATQILANGADVQVVANLLGHSGLDYVQVYTRAVDKKKKEAINSLPSINL